MKMSGRMSGNSKQSAASLVKIPTQGPKPIRGRWDDDSNKGGVSVIGAVKILALPQRGGV